MEVLGAQRDQRERWASRTKVLCTTTLATSSG
jgi:hypothetical protein